MMRRREGREAATATTSGSSSKDEDARPVVVANLRAITYSMTIFVALIVCTGLRLQVVAADKTTPNRLRRHDAKRLDISEIFELGGYSESRQNRQRELGKKRKKVRLA